jgi:hypothetical protein
MYPLTRRLMHHDSRIARIGRRIVELQRPVRRRPVIIGGEQLAGELLQHIEARMRIGAVKLAPRRQQRRPAKPAYPAASTRLTS